MAAIAVLSSGGTANAHHDQHDFIFPSDNYRNGTSTCSGGFVQLCKADSSFHSYTFFNLRFFKGAIDHRADGWADINTGSGMFFHFQDTESSPSIPEHIDVIWADGSSFLPSTTRGRARCQRALSNGRCEQFIVLMNLDVIEGDPFWRLKRSACHEWGHTMGLLHGANTTPTKDNDFKLSRCMTAPAIYGYGGGHNYEVLNATY